MEFELINKIKQLSEEMGLELGYENTQISELNAIAGITHKNENIGALSICEEDNGRSFAYRGTHPKIQNGLFPISLSAYQKKGEYFRNENHEIDFLGFPQFREANLFMKTIAEKNLAKYLMNKKN